MITVANASFYGGDKNIKGIVDQPKYDGVEYKLFTNRPELTKGTVWEGIYSETATPRLSARRIKTMIHEYVPDTNYWFWLDSNMKIQVDPNRLVNFYLEKFDICLMPHPERNNWYEEAGIVTGRLDDAEKVKTLIHKYYSEGFVPTTLYETGCLLRRNTKEIREFNKTWWNEVYSGSIRDQLSFPYSAWKHGLAVNTFAGTNSVNELRKKNKPYLPQWDDVIREWN